MTWLLKIKFETKECLDKWVDGTNSIGTGKDTFYGVIDMEFEELEEN